MKNKKTIINLIAIFTVLLAMTSIVYAIFYVEFNDIGLGGGGGKAELEYNYNTASVSSTQFKGVGSSIERVINLKNIGNVPLTYKIYTTLTEDSGLSRAVLVYIDGNLIGNLYDLTQNNGYKYLKSPLYPGESIDHTVKLEYHIGASDYYADKTFKLEISIDAKSLSPQEAIFVKNEKDLRQVLKNKNYDGKTVILTEDIVLTEALIATNLINIDLNGHFIDTDIYSLEFVSESNLSAEIYSLKTGGNLIGNFNVNLNNGLILSEFNLTYIKINKDLLKTEYSKFIDKILSKPIENSLNEGVEVEIDVAGKFKNFYFSISEENGESWLSLSEKGILAPLKRDIRDRNITFKINLALNKLYLDANIYEFSELYTSALQAPNDYGIGQAILVENVKHLSGAHINNELDRGEIKTDIFLPTRALNYNASIEWISGAPDILSANGEYTPSFLDKEFELYAIVTFNNRVYTYTYYLKTGEMMSNDRIKLFRLQNSPITFRNIGETVELVTQNADLEISNVEYSLPTDLDGNSFGSLFELDGNKLTLTADTSVKNAKIRFSLEIGGSRLDDESMFLDILIDIAKNVSIFDAAYKFTVDYLDNYITENNLGEYILKDFYLPSIYAGLAEISFEVLDSFTLDRTYQNPINFSSLVNVTETAVNEAVLNYAKVNPYNFTQDNGEVYLKVNISYNGETQSRALPIKFAGILHNSEEDIKDVSLYFALLQIYDINKDTFITRSEIDSLKTSNLSLSVTNKGVSSLKGMEFFNGLKEVYLDGNDIIDLAPLKNLISLEILSLSDNIISNLAPISNLIYLKTVNLEKNYIADIKYLENMLLLEKLQLGDNTALSNFETILKFKRLTYFSAYRDMGVSSTLSSNENFFITAYQNAKSVGGNLDSNVYFYLDPISTVSRYRPSDNQILANTVLNKLMPIYEFGRVIYLPYKLTYNNRNYSVTWTTSHTNIIKIEVLNGDLLKVNITQPISDVTVKLFADVTVNSQTVRRIISVISLKDEYQNVPKIVDKNGNELLAEIAIPDAALRYELFSRFDTNHDNIITQAEINIIFNEILSLSGLNIRSLKGLEHFTSITALDLTYNDFSDLSYISGLKLSDLYMNGAPDFSQLSGITSFKRLYIYGSTNVLEENTLSDLMVILQNNPNIEIYKDSPFIIWNPYEEVLAMALTTVEGFYKLNYQGNITLNTSLNINLFGVEETLELVFSAPSNARYIFRNNTLSYPNLPLTKDYYENLYVTVNKYGKSLTRGLTVILFASNDFYFKQSDGTVISLNEAFPNPTLRNTVINLYSGTVENGQKIILQSQTNFNAISSVTISGEPVSLKGLEFLNAQNLSSLTINGYKSNNLDLQNAISGFTNLKTLALNSGIYDLKDISALTKLETLSLENNILLKLDYITNPATNEYDTALRLLTKLKLLRITNSNINDFKALTKIKSKDLTKLYLYGNPASFSMLTNQYVGGIYANLNSWLISQIDFQITNKDVAWVAAKMGDIDAKINGVKLAEYTFHRANYIKSGDYVNLPKFNFKGMELEWTTSAPKSLRIVADGDNYKAEVINSDKYKNAYVIIKGKLVGLPSEITYIFIVSGNAANNVVRDANDAILSGETAIDLTDFMINGKLADPYFAYYALNIIKSDSIQVLKDTFGVPYNADKFTKFEYNVTDLNNIDMIKSIKGINVFNKLTVISLNRHLVEDLSPIYELTYNGGLGNTLLTSISFISNKISTLWYNGESVFNYAHNLKSVDIRNNENLSDFYPISYKYKNNLNDVRQGLDQLTTVKIGSSVNGGVSGYITYYQDPLEHLGFVIPWNEKVATGKALAAFKDETITDDGIQTLAAVINQIKNGSFLNQSINQIADGGTTIPVTSLKDKDDNDLALDYISFNNGSSVIKIIGNKITVTSEANYIPVKVPIIAKAVITGFPFYFLTYLQLDLESTRPLSSEKTNHWVEMEEYELLVRGLNLSILSQPTESNPIISKNNNYKDKVVYNVSAYYMIPDDVLRGFCFNSLNTTKDEVITLDERKSAGGYTQITSKGIKDLSGIDLYYNIAQLIVEDNAFKRLPKLYLTSSHKLIRIAFSRSHQFYDISNIIFKPSDSRYISFNEKVKNLSFFNCPSLSNEAIFYLSQCPNLEELSFYNVRITDFEGLKNLKNLKKIENLGFGLYNHNNTAVWQRLYLNSNNAVIIGELATDQKFPNAFISDFVYHNGVYLPKENPDDNDADDNNESYVIGRSRKLPKTFNLDGYSYNITYTEKDDTYYNVFIDQDGDFAIKIKNIEGIPSSISLNVFVNAYAEKLTLLVSGGSASSEDNINLNGTIETELGVYKSIGEVIPDLYLRIMMLNMADENNDGNLSYEELGKVTSFKKDFISNSVTNLQGIQYLYNLKEVSFKSAEIEDYSPLSYLKNVTSLELISNRVMIKDTEFLKEMTSLNYLSFFQTSLIFDLNGLEEVISLNTLHGVDLSSTLLNTLYVRNSIALQELNGNILSSSVSQSTVNQKTASLILRELKVPTVTNTATDVFEGVLQQEIFYNGKYYTLEYQTISQNSSVIDNKLNAKGKSGDYVYLIARIKIDYYNTTECYERLLKIKLP